MTDDQRDLVRKVFDGAAETYDHVGVDFFGPIADRLVTEVDPQPGQRCLDVGCGRGAVLFPLARLVGPTGHATGIDLSPNMIAATAADADAAGLDVTVRVGDAQAPEVDTGSIDLVTSSLVLFFLPDPSAALRAWRECLADGGRVGVSTFGRLSDSWHEVDAVFAPYLPPGMADPRTTASDSPFASDAGVEGLLIDAGFTQVRTVSETVDVRFDDEEQWHAWTWSVGQRRMWLQVPEAERPTVRAAAEERLQATRDADLRIGFEQVVRYTLGVR